MPDDAHADEPRIKGSGVREMLLWHDKQYGHAATVRLAQDTPAHLAWMLDRTQPALGILASSWYPVGVIRPMLDRVIEERGDEGRELAREANREVVPRMEALLRETMGRTGGGERQVARHHREL